MGDKISALPSATSVDGTELVPIVQGGATKKVTGLILRNPAGAAGGDLTGTYPNPTLASVTTAQIAVGSGSAIPVLTTDAKGRVVSLTTVINPALTTNQIAGLSTTAAAALAASGYAGISTSAARADHQHAFPTAAQVGALGATAAASGDLTGNYPNPSLATITSAQTAGSGTQIPVVSIDAKGRVTSLSTVAVSIATSAITALTGDVTASGPGAAAASLAAITTAQSNVGSSSVVPVLSVDAKGRVTALATAPISSMAGGTVTTITAGAGLSGGTITATGTIAIAPLTTAQSNVGSASAIPVLSINAQGQVTALSTVAIGSPTTTAITSLTGDVIATGPGAASASLAAITTAQSNVGSSTQVPVLSIDAKGRVTALSSVAVSVGYNIDALIVAGGGGGTGGGGGAGGLISTILSVSAGVVITATVGAGGAGVANISATGNNGSDSSVSLNAITAVGGGAGGTGGSPAGIGRSGGSGGGAGYNTLAGGGQGNSGGAGTSGQGNPGGSTPGISSSPTGGGGGAGAAGGNGSSAQGGSGGIGLQYSITGTAVYYAGGGGGSVAAGTQGTGGAGGGANGSPSTAGIAATANTGGGGGGVGSGSSFVGGNGGSGVVIFSVPTARYTGTVTGSPTVTTSGSNTIIKFTSSGTYTA